MTPVLRQRQENRGHDVYIKLLAASCALPRVSYGNLEICLTFDVKRYSGRRQLSPAGMTRARNVEDALRM